ncbi:Hypothetical predicted protein [Mytilus galloprovincialis]|uniref:Endonuclease/exonuclease/phosphatase domain-containing protein n=1 Tax=Mytilus galloprovincialis TaxID=29158 RepID=A0A8B6DSJ1_MYTGA|nr:Hypothetical predicted protein [Mytilus galloprovincialis]
MYTTDADTDYWETVDELSEIVLKYKSSYDIIIAGDMNASIARDKPNTKDKIFLDFIQEHCLYTPNGLCDVNTYFHPSGTCSTQIDYIIESTPGHRVNQFEVDPSCPMCKQGPEDRTHFLVLCKHLTTVRQPFMDALKIVKVEDYAMPYIARNTTLEYHYK